MRALPQLDPFESTAGARADLPPDAGTDILEDCWNRIGIRGDRSCAQLPAHVHCRNCPVYARAAQALLDNARLGEAAPESSTQASTTQTLHVDGAVAQAGRSVMVFRVGAECFALPTRRCVEIVPVRPIHSLPHRHQQALLGLVSVRGQLIVCLSLAKLLTVAPGQENGPRPRGAAALPRTRLILAAWQEGAIAFPVEEVLGIHTLPGASASMPPATVGRANSRLVETVFAAGDRTVGLLDEAQLHRAVQRSLA